MRIRTVIFMLCCLPLAAFSADRHSGPVFHALQVKDGLPQISVLDITQDRTGYMWFATRDGAARWDGYEFDVYKSEDGDGNSICSNYVTSMISSPDGCVWMGTLYGLSRYDSGKDVFVNYYAEESGLSDNRIRRLYLDGEDNVWCCTNNGICRYDASTGRFDGFLVEEEGENRIDCMVETKDRNVLMLGTQDGLLLFDWRCGTIRKLDVRGLKLNVRSLFRDCRGNIWVGTSNSGALMLDPRFNLIRHFTSDGSGLSVNNDFIRTIKEDNEGRILIGSVDGLNIYDPSEEKMLSYRQEDGLSSFSLHSIYCDRSNVVWLGSYVGGINYYTMSDRPFLGFEKPYVEDASLTGIVGPMVVDRTGLWIGMEGGGLLFYDKTDGSYRRYVLPVSSKDFRSNIINSLYMRGTTLWIGLNNGYILEFDTLAGKVNRTIELQGNVPVVSLYVDTDHTIYVGTFAELCGLIVISPDLKVTSLFTDDSGKECQFRNITSIVEDADGFILLASNADGIYRYNIHTRQYGFHKLEAPSLKYSEIAINQLHRAGDGSLWAATLNSGLLHLDSDLNVISCFSRSEGLLSNTVCSVVEAADNMVWCSTYSSISAIDPLGGSIRTWHIPSGCNEFSFRSVVRSGEKLYFGADCGMVSLDMTGTARPMTATPPVIKKITSNDNSTSMSFEYRSLDYIETGQIRYSYLLEGAGESWSRPAAKNHVNYVNIPPGRYVFRVRAYKSPDDVVGVEGESYSFRVLPPAWRRWWAVAAYIVFALFCAWMIYEVRNKKQQLERVENDYKEAVRKMLSSQFALQDDNDISSPDERFLRRLYEVMRNNLSSSELNTEFLCSEIGVSRTNLYYKLKALTGLSPTGFIRNHRVQLAARLMIEKNIPVSEVYDMVGFSSHPYFCSCFKKVLGCSPSEYIRRNKN